MEGPGGDLVGPPRPVSESGTTIEEAGTAASFDLVPSHVTAP
jgi:hypothetical protein